MLNDLKLFSRLPVNSDKILKHSHSANSEEYVKLYHSYYFDGIWFSNRSCHDFWHTNYFRSGTSRNSSKHCQRYQSHFSLHGQMIIFIRCYALAKSISFFFLLLNKFTAKSYSADKQKSLRFAFLFFIFKNGFEIYVCLHLSFMNFI